MRTGSSRAKARSLSHIDIEFFWVIMLTRLLTDAQCWTHAVQIRVQEAGRLLYAGQDDWVHVNCALWSAEVYEEGDGSLQAVHSAMARGRKLVSLLAQ
jgi:hypothetical protein